MRVRRLAGRLFLLFLIASAADIAAPGLGVAFVALAAAGKGRRRTIPGCLGIALGIAVLFAIALSGIGIVLAARPHLFAAIKAAGGLCIFCLAWRMRRRPHG